MAAIFSIKPSNKGIIPDMNKFAVCQHITVRLFFIYLPFQVLSSIMLSHYIVLASVLLAGIKVASCSKPDNDMPVIPAEPLYFEYDLDNLEIHNGFSESEARGVLENSYIIEASGLAVSRSNHSRIWVHNDSGDFNRLFVVGENAEDYGEFLIRGAFNRDWEDMAAGPGPVEGITYLYIGEIGDNHAQYEIMSIYRVPEPDISGLDSVAYEPVDGVERIDFVYPDGLSRDAETLMVDPWTRDIYIVTKRDERSILFAARYPQATGRVIALEKVGYFPFNRALAGDISADGTEIAVKTDDRIYYWSRNLDEPVYKALERQPLLLPYTVEPQGEAFGWMPDGSGYYTLSEKVDDIEPVLYFYSRK